MHLRIGLLAAAMMCAATVTDAGDSAGPFLGLWTVSEAKPAPWNSAPPAEPAKPTLLNAKMSFGRSRVDAPAPFGCSKAVYWSEARPATNLFAGSLQDPDRQASELGFSSRIVILSVGCETGSNAIPDVALVDEHTAMFALDNYIYVMKR